MPAKNTSDYQSLSAELDAVLMALQQPDVAVDDAVKLYEKGVALVAALEKHVEQAEHTLEKIHLKLESQDTE